MGMRKMMVMMGMLFMIIGIIMHVSVLTMEFGTFQPLQKQYWSISKAERDAAPTGSALAQQLAEIKNFPPKLMTYKLLGIGSYLVGIFIMLMGIFMAFGMMPQRISAAMAAMRKK